MSFQNFYLCFFIYMFLLLSLSCSPPDLPERSPKKHIIKKAKPTNKQKSLLAEIRQSQHYPKLNFPYSCIFYYTFLDTSKSKQLGNYFRGNIKDILQNHYEGTISSVVMENNLAEHIVKANQLPDIPSSFFQKTRQYEVCIAVSVYTAEKFFKMRRIHPQTGRMSPIIELAYDQVENIGEIVAQNFLYILGVEGYVIKSPNKDSEISIVFRGQKGLEEMTTKGSIFHLFIGKKRIANHFVKLTKTLASGDFLTAQGKVLGYYRPGGIEKLVAVYFPGGSQTIELTNYTNQPLEGFSIFTNYKDFDDAQKYYQGTTDISGKLKITDNKRGLLYLVVAKNEQNSNLIYLQLPTVVRPSTTIQLKINTWQEVQAPSTTKFSSREVAQIRNQAILRMGQAKKHIRDQKFAKAIINLNYSKQELQAVGVNKSSQLGKTLAIIEQVYNKALRRKQANENRLSAFKLMEKADKEMENTNYRQAQKLLERAKNLWPHTFYPKDYRHIEERLQQLPLFINEKQAKIGIAREFIYQQAFHFNKKNIALDKIRKLSKHCQIILRDGIFDKSKPYNDYNLILKLSIFLNKLSTELRTLAKYYDKKYKKYKKTNTKQRRAIYKQHLRYYNCGQQIDAVLRLLVNGND